MCLEEALLASYLELMLPFSPHKKSNVKVGNMHRLKEQKQDKLH